MNTRPEKHYTAGNGPFTITHRYYRDGTYRNFVGSAPTDLLSQPYIEFAYCYDVNNYLVRESIDAEWQPLTKKEIRVSITLHCPLTLRANGVSYVHTLNEKSVSARKLDSHKTWFAYMDLSKYQFNRDRRKPDPSVIVLKGFRRVPRKWIPEFDAFFGLETPAYPL